MTTLAKFCGLTRYAQRLLVGLVAAIAFAALIPPTSAHELQPPSLSHADQPASLIRQSEVAITTQSNNQLSPAIAAGSSGYLVAWAHEASATNHDIYFRRLGSDGLPLGSPAGLATGVQFEGNPAVAYNPTDDEYLVVWEHAFSASDHDIYARRISGSGAPLGGTFVVVNSGTDESNPVVTFNQEAGQYLVVYEYQAAGGNRDIYARRVGGDGTLPGSIIPVATGSTDQSAPATSAGSNYLVVWQVAHPTSGEYDIYGQRVDAYGSLSGGSIAISTWQYDQLKPRLAFNAAAGEWLVVWEDHHWGWGAYRDIYGQRVNYDGTLDGGNFGIAWGNNRENPDVAYNSVGSEYMVVWEYVLSASDHDVYRRRISANGSLLDSEAAVSRGSAFEGHPAVAADANRAYVAVWEDGRNQLLNGLDLYGERFAPYLLSGGVYAGAVGDTSTPLADVTVQLGCAGNPDDFGDQIAVTQTGATGNFSLPSYHTCEYYQLRETDPTDYTSNGATSVGGVVVNSNQIRYAFPLAGKILSGNRFFDAPPAPIDTTPPGTWAAFSPTGWQTVQSVPVSVRVEDGDSGLDVGTAQYAYSTNGGFSWSSWLPAACTGSGGETSPQTVSATVAFGQDGGPGAQNLVRFRISDRAGNVGTSPNYTVLIDTVPPPNPASLFSPSHSVAAWSNNNRVTAQWSGAVDDRSGIAGYSYEWSQSPTTLPGPWVDSSSVVVTSSALADANNWYFHLRAIDVAGNAATSALHLGPFYIDTTPPNSWMTALAAEQDQRTFGVSWGASSGAGSPIVNYTLTVGDQYDGGVTLNTWLSDTTLSSDSYTGQRSHTYYFHVQARDEAGNLEPYDAIADTYTTVGKDLVVWVKDEGGNSVVGAKIYYEGVYAGQTNSGGYVDVPDGLLGDSIAALRQVYEKPSLKGHHHLGGSSDWAWHVFQTNVQVEANGTTHLYEVTDSTIPQVVTVRKDRPLVGLHMVVSMQWDAAAAKIDDLAAGLRDMTAALYDAGDGQFFVERIEIYDAGSHWADADMRVRTSNNEGEMAHPWAIVEGSGRAIYVGRAKFCPPSDYNWSHQCAYKTILHELGHYGLGLYDEYRKRDGTTWSYCAANATSVGIDERASIMWDQFQTTEFCSTVHATHVHRTQTQQDAENNGESSWETMVRHYSDSQTPARWTLTTPDDRGQIMAGPAAMPVSTWTEVYTTNLDTGVCAPFPVQATYLGSNLDKAEVYVLPAAGASQPLYQGQTNASGQLSILGAYTGDHVFIYKMVKNPATSGQTLAYQIDPVSCSASHSTHLTMMDVEAEPAPFDLLIRVIPLSETSFRLEIEPSVTLAETPEVAVWQDGATSPHVPSLSLDGGVYSGQVALDPALPLVGSIRLEATDTTAATMPAIQPFTLESVEAGDNNLMLYSSDGQFELFLPDGSLNSDAALVIQQTSLPGPLPAHLTPIGSCYQPLLSNGQTDLNSAAVLYLRYRLEAIGSDNLDTIRVYGWDGVTWQSLGGDHVPAFQMVSTTTDKLMTFCLIQASDNGGHKYYLPVILKKATPGP